MDIAILAASLERAFHGVVTAEDCGGELKITTADKSCWIDGTGLICGESGVGSGRLAVGVYECGAGVSAAPHR